MCISRYNNRLSPMEAIWGHTLTGKTLAVSYSWSYQRQKDKTWDGDDRFGRSKKGGRVTALKNHQFHWIVSPFFAEKVGSKSRKAEPIERVGIV